MSHVSASFSATIRVRLTDCAGLVRAPGEGDRRGRRLARRDRPRARREGHQDPRRHRRRVRLRPPGADRRERPRGRGRRGRAGLRPHVPDAPRRQDRDALEGAGQDARRPLDGLHAGRRPCLHGRSHEDRELGLEPDDQAEHGRGRLRRHGGARPRRHRPGGGDARDGGEGAAVQGVRRRGRVADLPGHEGHGRDRRDREGDRPRLRRHQPRGHLGAALLRDRGSGCAPSSTSPSSTTTSTAPRSSCWRRC